MALRSGMWLDVNYEVKVALRKQPWKKIHGQDMVMILSLIFNVNVLRMFRDV